MLELFKTLRKLKPQRKDWYVKPAIKIEIDREYYVFHFLPTVVWMPWPYRYPDQFIVCISWFNLHIGFFKWIRKEAKNDA